MYDDRFVVDEIRLGVRIVADIKPTIKTRLTDRHRHAYIGSNCWCNC